MAQDWQKIDGAWLVCHSWQDVEGSRITAMTTVLVLALLLTAAVWATVRWLSSDGYGRRDDPSELREWHVADLPSHPFRATHHLG